MRGGDGRVLPTFHGLGSFPSTANRRPDVARESAVRLRSA
jgi:hypothetical protein